MKDDSDLSAADRPDPADSERSSGLLRSLIGGLDVVRIVVLVCIIVAMILVSI